MILLGFGDIVIKKKKSPKNLEWPVSPDTGIPVTHATLENQLEAGDEVEVSAIFDCSCISGKVWDATSL